MAVETCYMANTIQRETFEGENVCALPFREVFFHQLRGSWGIDIDEAAQSGSHIGQIEHQV